jgi:hypothetical protein
MDTITALDTTVTDIRRIAQLITYEVPVDGILGAFKDKSPTDVFHLYAAAKVYLQYATKEL